MLTARSIALFIMSNKSISFLAGVSVIGGLYLASLSNYLLFHTLMELFCIVIACGIFIIAWNSRWIVKDGYLSFIGIMYLFVAVIDLLHTLSYKGMGIFQGYGSNLPTQLWIAGRYLESLSLLVAFRFFGRKLKANLIFFIYLTISSLVFVSIFTKTFPNCFLEGSGLTPFKKVSEYLISLILVSALILLSLKRDKFDQEIAQFLAISIVLTIYSELMFTLYIDVFGLFNMAGHLLKLFSFYFIYKAIIETGFTKPYRLLFRNLKQSNEQLQQEIVEHKQTSVELQKAKEAAESANNTKSEFLTNMSHELRTPLNGILGYAQILQRKGNLTEFQLKRLEIIEKSGKHLLNLINDILDIAKIEAQKMELHNANFSLPEFLQTIAAMIRIRAQEKDISFTYETTADLPLIVCGDEKLLSQILLNLLSNAVKFTEQGGVTFTVGSRGTNIRFLIADTGVGIPHHRLKDIFLPFEQIADHARKKEGTGLGLSISRQLVRLMGGELQVQSIPGKGSTFGFELLLPEVSVPIVRERDKQEIIGFKGNARKILVIDDRWENRSVLIDFLSPIGFEVLEAENGYDGLKKASEFQPDLLFIDLVMPDIDGFEVIRQVRSLPVLKHCKIFAISASLHGLAHYKSESERTYDEFIPKPLHLQEVLDKLQTHLQLEWIYKHPLEEPTTIEGDVGLAKDGHVDTIPPRSDLEKLYKLAVRGDIMGLREQLSLLEQLNEQYLPFVKKLQTLAMTFQIKQIQLFIEKCQGG